ncbi:MAG TPA: hypothetical protein VML55_23440, partial [Planctomycetaceae bacterium]|nr:hypothetical protein [Planctomycetaceae bacterium]
GTRPVELTSWKRPPDSDKWELLQSSHATWTQASDVWIPKTWTMESGSTGSRTELRFDWETVNQHVPPETFQIEGFDAPKGTSIYSRQSGPASKLIFVGRVGVPATGVPEP